MNMVRIKMWNLVKTGTNFTGPAAHRSSPAPSPWRGSQRSASSALGASAQPSSGQRSQTEHPHGNLKHTANLKSWHGTRTGWRWPCSGNWPGPGPCSGSWTGTRPGSGSGFVLVQTKTTKTIRFLSILLEMLLVLLPEHEMFQALRLESSYCLIFGCDIISINYFIEPFIISDFTDTYGRISPP